MQKDTVTMASKNSNKKQDEAPSFAIDGPLGESLEENIQTSVVIEEEDRAPSPPQEEKTAPPQTQPTEAEKVDAELQKELDTRLQAIADDRNAAARLSGNSNESPNSSSPNASPNNVMEMKVEMMQRKATPPAEREDGAVLKAGSSLVEKEITRSMESAKKKKVVTEVSRAGTRQNR